MEENNIKIGAYEAGSWNGIVFLVNDQAAFQLRVGTLSEYGDYLDGDINTSYRNQGRLPQAGQPRTKPREEATEEEAPARGFFKPEAKPSSAGDEQAPKAGFFANAAAPTTTSGSATRSSFFNPGGVTNPFLGGSDNNEVRADSDLERDSEQEIESNND